MVCEAGHDGTSPNGGMLAVQPNRPIVPGQSASFRFGEVPAVDRRTLGRCPGPRTVWVEALALRTTDKFVICVALVRHNRTDAAVGVSGHDAVGEGTGLGRRGARHRRTRGRCPGPRT